jgi:hypothetical protein
MRRIAPIDLGISPHVQAVMVLFCSRDRDVLGVADLYDEEHTDIRVTAFYRPDRGGILIRARRSVDEPDPFLHLAVVPHGSSDKLVVFEWVAPWASVPPTTDVTPAHEAEGLTLPEGFDEDAIVPLVEYLLRRVREHLKKTRKVRR